MLFRTRNLILGALGGALAATVVFAAEGEHAGAIGARKSLMGLYGFNLGPLGAMAKGEMPYDAEIAGAAAANLAALTKLNNARMWPQGSDSLSVEGTRALPDIWDNLADVGAKAQNLSDAADAMAAAAGTDLAALQAAMGAVGGACGACHKAYRQPE